MNKLNPTSKPICQLVQQHLYQYKSFKDFDKKDSNYKDLFQSTDSFDTPQQETTQETTLASIQQSQTTELLTKNDIILHTAYNNSVFKYLQQNELSQQKSQANLLVKDNKDIKNNKDKSPLRRQQIKPQLDCKSRSISTNKVNRKSVSPLRKENVKPTQYQVNKSTQQLKQQSHILVDFTKCPTQRVMIKENNTVRMNVEMNLKSLLRKNV